MSKALTEGQASLRRGQLTRLAHDPNWIVCPNCGGEDMNCYHCDGEGGWFRDDVPEEREA